MYTGNSEEYLNGLEQWTFTKVNGQWYISKFVYNACPPPIPQQKPLGGISFPSWWHGEYQSAEAQRAFTQMEAAIHPACVAIVVTQYQKNADSTEIYLTPQTATDEDLVFAFNEVHQVLACVFFSVHLDPEDTTHWHGEIGKHFSPVQWSEWFSSYQKMIGHYADLAQQSHVEILSVGNELVSASSHSSDWRAFIKQIRSRYNGQLTYSADWKQEMNDLQWWDAVDLIGVNVYFPVGQHPDPSIQELLTTWRSHTASLANLSSRWRKPILMTEIGYRSLKGASTYPWEYRGGGPVDLQEQANAYDALFKSVWGKPWFKGLFVWYWSTRPDKGGPSDTDFFIKDKPAQKIIASWFSKT